jgi:hypothetical protein
MAFKKIRQESKLLNRNSTTLTDVKIAAIYCILQTMLSLVNSMINSMFLFMDSNVVDVGSTVLMKFYIFVSAMVDEMMICTVIIDFVLTLTMLKVYRNALSGC